MICSNLPKDSALALVTRFFALLKAPSGRMAKQIPHCHGEKPSLKEIYTSPRFTIFLGHFVLAHAVFSLHTQIIAHKHIALVDLRHVLPSIV
jgi:hypothetical protein